MAPPRWTTEVEQSFLESNKASYLTHKKKRTLRKFWPGLAAAWFEQFPEKLRLHAPEMILTPEMNEKLNEDIAAREKQLANWFRNNCGGSARRARSSPALALGGRPKGRRGFKAVEVYSRRYYASKLRDSVHAEIKKLGLGHKESLQLITRRTREAFEAESPEVRAEIFAAKEALKIAPDSEDSKETITPEAYQQALDDCISHFEIIFTELMRRTGWCWSIIGGGPCPEENGELRVIGYHIGKNPSGHLFGEVLGADWDKNIASPFLKFLEPIYSLEERKQRAIRTSDSDGDSEDDDTVNEADLEALDLTLAINPIAALPSASTSSTHTDNTHRTIEKPVQDSVDNSEPSVVNSTPEHSEPLSSVAHNSSSVQNTSDLPSISRDLPSMPGGPSASSEPHNSLPAPRSPAPPGSPSSSAPPHNPLPIQDRSPTSGCPNMSAALPNSFVRPSSAAQNPDPLPNNPGSDTISSPALGNSASSATTQNFHFPQNNPDESSVPNQSNSVPTVLNPLSTPVSNPEMAFTSNPWMNDQMMGFNSLASVPGLMSMDPSFNMSNYGNSWGNLMPNPMFPNPLVYPSYSQPLCNPLLQMPSTQAGAYGQTFSFNTPSVSHAWMNLPSTDFDPSSSIDPGTISEPTGGGSDKFSGPTGGGSDESTEPASSANASLETEGDATAKLPARPARTRRPPKSKDADWSISSAAKRKTSNEGDETSESENTTRAKKRGKKQ